MLLVPEELPVINKNIESTERYTIVLYADGGCANNKAGGGKAGAGLHGYTFTDKVINKGTGCKKAIMTAKGYVAAGQDKEKLDIVYYYDGYWPLDNKTNNQAELTAIIKGLNLVIEELSDGKNVTQAYLYSDSEYCVKGINNHLNNWIKNGWVKQDKTEVLNLEYWKDIETRLTLIKQSGVKLTIGWVKAHSKTDPNLGNIKADFLASCAVNSTKANYLEPVIVKSNPSGYWETGVDYNRLLGHNRLYFNCNTAKEMSNDGRHVYYLGYCGKDDSIRDLGQANTSTWYSVLMLKEPCLLADKIRDIQSRTINEFLNKNPSYLYLSRDALVIARLDNILTQSSEFIIKGGGYGFEVVNKNCDLSIPGDTVVPVTLVQNPPALSRVAVQTMLGIEHVLVSVLAKDSSYLVTDITEMFYETVIEKKKTVTKLIKDINAATVSVEVQASYDLSAAGTGIANIKLTMDNDLPNRNTLAGIAENNPRISIITWPESPIALRYAVVIETDDDAGIWVNPYTNIRALGVIPNIS